TIYWQIDFSAMQKHEKKALETMDHDLKKEAQENVAPLSYAFDLMLPILTLVISTIVLFLFSGNYFNKNVSLIQATGDGDIVNSLLYGGIFAIIVAAVLYLPTKKLKITSFVYSFFTGIWKMVGAAIILVLAWTIVSIIENLDYGLFLAQLIDCNLALVLLPVERITLCSLIDYATRTSWGTFAIMVPIAVSITGEIRSECILPAVGAFFAGSVFGDHISPIS